eukprot:4289192-Prymnesium_polylepis.2
MTAAACRTFMRRRIHTTDGQATRPTRRGSIRARSRSVRSRTQSVCVLRFLREAQRERERDPQLRHTALMDDGRNHPRITCAHPPAAPAARARRRGGHVRRAGGVDTADVRGEGETHTSGYRRKGERLHT